MSLTASAPSWTTRSLPRGGYKDSGFGGDPAGQNSGTFGGPVPSNPATGTSQFGAKFPSAQSMASKLMGGSGPQNYSMNTGTFGGSAPPATPVPITPGTTGGDPQSPYMSQYGPQIASITGQLGVIQSQIPWIWKDKNLSGQQLQSQYGYDSQRFALRDQILGLDRGNVDYDRGYFGNLKGILGKERGTAEQQYQLKLEQLNADANNSMRDHKSNYVSSGSLFAPQTTREYANIYANLDRSRKGETFGYEREKMGFDRQDLGLDRDLYRNETEGKKLDILAKQYGVDKSELESKLKFGLQQLGLDADKSLAQIMAQMNSLGDQGSALLVQIWEMVNSGGNANISGYNPYAQA
jgi:hypothetical protein